MDQSKVDTASTYVNNLLLARGLLRDAKPIDFARLARSSRALTSTLDTNNDCDTVRPTLKQAPSTTAAAEIINLVHDLVLRRDRDQEQYESVALTLRTLRAEASRESAELARLTRHNAELRRQLATQEAARTAAERTARGAEASARSLRDESARLKTVLQQVRTQCANDVRRRDVELAKLKTHLATRQRGGNKGALVGASITINPGSTGRRAAASSQQQQQLGEDEPNVEDVEYNLKQETTDFLTQLSQGLSEENDSLIGLIRTTLHTLKDLLGLPHNQAQRDSLPGSSMGHSTGHDEQLVQCSPTSFQTLSTDLDGVLSNLCELLTNPSFAPIEEVHSREEEIVRLKDGWLKMETRWHEAISLMQGWKKRMLNGGGNVNVDELKNGLRLGEGLDSPSRQFSSTLFDMDAPDATDAELDAISEPSEPEDDEPNIDDFSEVEEDYVPHDDEPVLEAAPPASAASDQAQLQERDGNITAATREPAHGSPDGEAKENESAEPGHAASNHATDPPPAAKPKTAPKASRTARPALKQAPLPNPQARKQTAKQPRVISGRLPKPARPAKEPGPALSVDEKLRLAESEAQRVSSSPLEKRSLLARSKGRSQGAAATKEAKPSEAKSSEAKLSEAAVKADGARKEPVRRSRISGRPRRRKSTLSPEELEDLMGS